MSLKLIQNYSSGESEEDEDAEVKNKLVTDSGGKTTENKDKKAAWSESNENLVPKNTTVCVKGKEGRLPLPQELQNMFSDNKKVEEDDPDKHEGRVRSFPHARGNWVSFVHIPLNNSEGVIRQMETVKRVLLEFPDLGGINFCEDLHLSLSKTVVFRHHWIDSFMSALKDNFANINRFHLLFQDFETYVNEENTRTFIAINIQPSPQLLQLVKACDLALAEYDLESYYEDPSFHVSVFWILGNQSKFLKSSVLPLLNSYWRELCESEPDLQVQLVDTIWFKTGNRMCNFQLSCKNAAT